MDDALYMRSVLILAMLLGVIFLGAVALRRFGPARHLMASRGARKRLRIVESALIDGRRRLVLVRCDDRDHLLMIGGVTDLVVAHDLPPPERADPAGSGDEGPGASSGTAFRTLLSRQERSAP
jgi:flagellar protein FliO/FliZ